MSLPLIKQIVLLGDILSGRRALAARDVDVCDFSLEKHRMIFKCMVELSKRGDPIDTVSVAHELMKRGQLESCDGLTYLVELDNCFTGQVNG